MGSASTPGNLSLCTKTLENMFKLKRLLLQSHAASTLRISLETSSCEKITERAWIFSLCAKRHVFMPHD